MSLQKYKKRYPNFIDLSFTCSTEDRYIYVKNRDSNDRFRVETPFLKVLKPVHNYKDKSYIILSVNNDFDFNDEVNDFVYMINKIHEFSQENIKLDSKKWFGKDFDIFDLDNIVKRPIEEHKSNNYIKLVINNSDVMEQKLANLEKEMYIKCSIEFNGLKISRETLMEEWYVMDYITQEDYENLNNVKELEESTVIYTPEIEEEVVKEIVEEMKETINQVVQDVEEETKETINQVVQVDDNVSVDVVSISAVASEIQSSVLPSTESKRKHKKNGKTNLITRKKIFTIEK